MLDRCQAWELEIGATFLGPEEPIISGIRGFVVMNDGVLKGNKAIDDLTLCRASEILGVLGYLRKKRLSEPFAISLCSLIYAFFSNRRGHRGVFPNIPACRCRRLSNVNRGVAQPG